MEQKLYYVPFFSNILDPQIFTDESSSSLGDRKRSGIRVVLKMSPSRQTMFVWEGSVRSGETYGGDVPRRNGQVCGAFESAAL